MAENINIITIIGHLTRDPETFTYNSAQGPAEGTKFSVAVNKRDGAGGVKRDPDYFDVSVFGGQAAPCKQYLSKGRAVGVTGRMESRKVTSGEGEAQRTITYWGVTADNVQFLSDGKGGERPAPEPVGAGAESDLGF